MITEIRRKDRAITDIGEIKRILSVTPVGYVALCRENAPYVIPVNYFYQEDKIYIHCALEGKKLAYIEENPNVCFLANHPVLGSGHGCGEAVNYHSVIAFGKARFLKHYDADILRRLGEKYNRCSELSHDKMDRTGLIEIQIESVSAKRGYPDK